VPVRTVHRDGDIKMHHAVVHYHRIKGPVAACVPMHQDVADGIVVEVAGAVHDPIRSAHRDLDLSLYPTKGRHLIDQKLPGLVGRIINVNEEVGYIVAIEIAGADEMLVGTDRAKHRRGPISLDRLELPHPTLVPDQEKIGAAVEKVEK